MALKDAKVGEVESVRRKVEKSLPNTPKKALGLKLAKNGRFLYRFKYSLTMPVAGPLSCGSILINGFEGRA